MKIIIQTLLLVYFFAADVFAQQYKIDEGFYTGFDPTKFDENKVDIDRSVEVKAKPVDGKFYGYKFNDRGFFLAPEAVRKVEQNNLHVKSFDDSQNPSARDNINYNIKANVGYEFNNGFSGFVTYDVGDFSYNSAQRSVAINQGNSAVGFGSQINFSEDFSLKVTYTQQQNYDTSIEGGKIKSDVVRFGTSYSF